MIGSSGRLSRRRFLRHAGATAALIPLVHVAGCSDGSSDAAGEAAEETAAPPAATTDPAAAPAAGQPAGATAMPRLDEDDPTAQALGYRHDAGEVDTERHPRLQPGQSCSNCALYQSDQGGQEGWGGCSIFPGKLVNAGGWCSAYVPA